MQWFHRVIACQYVKLWISSLGVFNYFLVILGVFILFFLGAMGSLNFILWTLEDFFFFLNVWASSISSCHFGGPHFLFLVQRGVFAFLLVNFKSSLFSYFEFLELKNFLLVIFGVFNFFLWWGGGGLCSCGFWEFLLYYFEVSKFSIFLLVILWVFKKHCVKFRKGRKRGYLPFLLWILKVFVSIFWSSKISNFLLVILGVFQKNCVKFHKWGNGVCVFLHGNFESFLFSYFEISEY